jgi:CRP-like cAMP-binding protein
MFKKQKADPAAAGALRDVAFFEGFSDAELVRVAELAEDVEAEQGALLMDQGNVGQECYVILEGQAGVYMGGEHVATLEAGSMVGEMALVDHRPRTASVIAETPMKLISFNTKAFRKLLEEFPEANDRVTQLLTARLKANS